MVANLQNQFQTPESKSGPGLIVVLYLRMSLREQRFSIDQQRHECRAYAESRGWIIAGEYIDNGKSGSKELRKRIAFHQMIADAEKPGRKWHAILCWDSSRFGRLDMLKGAAHKDRLRDAGVWLETSKGERIDWTTSMGRVMDALQSEQNHEFSTKLSRDVVRGRKLITEMGFLAVPVPFGYDRQYVENGVTQMTVQRKKAFSKPRNWRLKPVINTTEAVTIRWMYEQWGTRDMSFGMTVRELYERGIKSPAGEPSWTIAQVKRVLTDVIYTGAVRIGKGVKSKEVFNRMGEQSKADSHDAIIDPKRFAIVAAKVKAREGAEWLPKSNSGALSGVLKCGKCGHTLARRVYSGYQYYVCESASKRPHFGCSQWRACEDELLPVISAELVDAIDFEVLQKLQAQPEVQKADIEKMTAEAARLKKQMDRAAKNMLMVDPENFATAQNAMNDVRKEYERAANALKLATSDAGKSEREGWLAWWNENRADFVSVTKWGTRIADDWPEDNYGLPESERPTGGVIGTIERVHIQPDTFRDLLRRLNVEVVLHWTRYGVRNWRLTTGTLTASFSRNSTGAELDVSTDRSATPVRRVRRSG